MAKAEVVRFTTSEFSFDDQRFPDECMAGQTDTSRMVVETSAIGNYISQTNQTAAKVNLTT